MVGVDCSLIMNPQVWVASGHVGGFADKMVDCKKCRKRFRADKVFFAAALDPVGKAAAVLAYEANDPGEASKLAVDLFVCVGNVDAIRAGKRFIDADLNRMFRPVRGSLAQAAESARADAMIAATKAFFDAAGPERWHLDLHTAIRPSVYPTFAIVPDLVADARAGEAEAMSERLGAPSSVTEAAAGVAAGLAAAKAVFPASGSASARASSGWPEARAEGWAKS